MVRKAWEKEAERAAKAARNRLTQPYPSVVVDMSAARRRGRRRKSDEVQLPQFNTSRYADTTAPAAGDDEQRPGEAFQAAVVASAKWTGRNRWELTPPVATVAAVAGATTEPVATMVSLTALAAAVSVAPETIFGRVWLSQRERGNVAAWAAGTTAWTVGATAGAWGLNGGGLVALAVLTGYQSFDWYRSRRIRTNGKPKLSQDARDLMKAWPSKVGAFGPDPIRGSRIVTDTMTEPNEGTFAFAVELRDAVHAEDAVNDNLRKYLERSLRMGVGTVELDIDRDDSARIRVTLTPSRFLEKIAAEWQGAILHDNGLIPFADTADGRVIDVGLHNDDGVEHFAIFGTTGVGKSNSLTAMVLPGVLARREVLIYVDGGGGDSCSHLAAACDWWAVGGVDEWRTAIRTVHAIMRDRMERRGAQGLSRWRGVAEPDPIITLVADEATTVNNQLDSDTQTKYLEILREGRKRGVRGGQLAQDPMGSDVIGGRKARGLMGGGGSLIGHRPGDGTANMLTVSSTGKAGIDLRRLPPEPGWCGIIRRGQVLTKAARVRFATEEKVLDALDGVLVRGLEGADRRAAGKAYAERTHGLVAAARHAKAQDRPLSEKTLKALQALAASGVKVEDIEGYDTNGLHAPAQKAATGSDDVDLIDVDAAAEAEIAANAEKFPLLAPALTGSQRAAANTANLNRNTILAALRGVEDGLTRGQLAQETGMKEKTIYRALKALKEDGYVTQDEALAWHPASRQAQAA